jgi:hypothetical protein
MFGERLLNSHYLPDEAISDNRGRIMKNATDVTSCDSGTLETDAHIGRNENTYLTISDPALLVAWQRLLAYFEESKRQRRLGTILRRALIGFTWLASVLAVLIALPYFSSREITKELLRISLILLPILLAGLMTFAIEFTPSVTWIVHSALFNAIDHEIFRYRMKVGDYREEFPISERQRNLVQNIERQKMTNVVPIIESEIPYWNYEATATNIPAYVKKHYLYWTKDDGFSPLSSTQYLEQRVLIRRDWYVAKSRGLFRSERRFKAAILVIAGIGSIAAGISANLAWLVVITTATVTAITSYGQLRRNTEDHTAYFDTIHKIDERLALWRILPEHERTSPEVTSNLASDIEDLFREEIIMWQRQARRAQSVAEQSLIQNVRELIRDEKRSNSSSLTVMEHTKQPESANNVND